MWSLRNISYPAQVLAKSCKMVPVMLMGTLVYGMRYSAVEYVCMSLVGLGIALFAQHNASTVTSKLAQPNSMLGYSLVAVNLIFDGYTNSSQDHLNSLSPNNPPLHMMAWMNFWTAAYSAVYMFAVTGKGLGVLGFCQRHPAAAWDMMLFCLCGALGQLFVFLTIKLFSSLVTTLVCTTRKFFSILFSVLVNGNPLLPEQWAAAAMVFSGLIASSFVTRRQKRKQQ